MSYMENWYAGPDKANIAQRSNGWKEANTSRWSNDECDALFEKARTEIDPEALANLFVQMNDAVINNHVTVPIVLVSPGRGISKELRKENIARAGFRVDSGAPAPRNHRIKECPLWIRNEEAVLRCRHAVALY